VFEKFLAGASANSAGADNVRKLGNDELGPEPLAGGEGLRQAMADYRAIPSRRTISRLISASAHPV
jgi:hypothetical protein